MRAAATLRRLLGGATLLAAGAQAQSEPIAAEPARGPTTDVAAAEPTATDRAPVLAALDRLQEAIHRTTLDNGLRVVIHVDTSSPTVAVSVTYDVGSRNETPAQSGFAHLFEHMMFQGSRNVARGEHFRLITERGGTLNGTTSADRTNYFEQLPANELELALFLEADRMRWLDVSRENFENQRAVVQEEYRMRIDNAPYALGLVRLGELVYPDYPPYAHPTIGSLEALQNARLEWVQEFYAGYYGPNNAVLTIAGDVDVERALGLVRKHFAAAERREPPLFEAEVPPPAPVPAAAPQALEDPNANAPAVIWAYRIPPFRSQAHYALELAALLLADGESSRLHQALVRERPVLQEASAWTDDRRGPDQLTLMGVLNEGTRVEPVERAFADAMERLRQAPPSQAELERIKNRLRHAFAFGLESNVQRAVKLGEYELYYGDARLLPRELERYLEVTPEDVQRAAARYLVPERRVVLRVLPASPKEAP